MRFISLTRFHKPNTSQEHASNFWRQQEGIAALIALGERDRARDWIARALVVAGDDILTQYNVACGYTKLGETDRALDLLERMLPKAGQEIQVWVTHDSDFDDLRSHPRFERLLESIKKP